MSPIQNTLRPVTQQTLGAMNPEQIVMLGRQLCSQLGGDPDGCHGNVYPGNIFLDEEGNAVLGEGSDAPVSMRSPEQLEYMAPELFWDNDAGRSADLYSIGLVLYTAYNGGRLPFIAGSEPTDRERAQALRARMKGQEIPPLETAGEEVGAIIAKSLNYEKFLRPLDQKELLRLLSDTDEALPSYAPAEGEEDLRSAAAAAAAATGLAGVSAVANASSLPVEQVRPVQTASDFSAESIVMEQEIRDWTREAPAEAPESAPMTEEAPAEAPESAPVTEEASAEAPESAPVTEEVPAEVPESAPVTEKTLPTEEAIPEAEELHTIEALSAPATPAAKPAFHADRSKSAAQARTAPAKTKGKKRGAVAVIGAGLVVIAGMIGVAVYSLGGLNSGEAAATPVPTSVPTAEAVLTPAPEPTAEPEPAEKFDVIATDLSWTELSAPIAEGGKGLSLAVVHSEEALSSIIESAERAGLKNLWLGASFRDEAEAPGNEAGWYWNDDTQLPENSSFWAEDEPSAAAGAHLMLSRNDKDRSWKFRAVTEEAFEAGGEDAFSDLGYAVSGSGRIVKATPRPSPTPTVTPAARDIPGTGVVSQPVYQPTAVPFPVPTAAPTAVPTAAPAPTPNPTAAPEPEPTVVPAAFKAVLSDMGWSGIGETMVFVLSPADFAKVTDFLDKYNDAQEAGQKLENVWLGALYLAGDEAPGGIAGWYWADTDQSPLDTGDENWAAGEPSVSEGAHLMLRLQSDGSWQYFAVTDEQFNTSDYPNSGYLTKNAG